MPVARFQTPDGRVARFEVPEGTTPDQAQSMMEKEFPNIVHTTQPASVTDKFLGHPLVRAGLGSASVLTAPFQLGANIGDKAAEALGFEPVVGKWTNEKLAELEAMKRRGMAAATGNPVGEDWDVAGTIGALVPGTAVYKGIAKSLPNVISEQAPSLTGRTIGRMLSGGGMAATTLPVISGGKDYLSEKAIQTGVGAAVPVGISTVGSLLRGGGKILAQSYNSLRDTIRNFTEGGQTKLAEGHLRELASEGGEPALKKTIGSLMKDRKILSEPTSAENIAAENIGKGERFGGPIVRLQNELANLPETTTKLRSIEAAQEQIRKSALKNIAKGQSEESALLERKVASDKNYKEAFKDVVKSDDVLKTLMLRPSMANVLARAKDLAAEEGKGFNIGNKYPVESLHYMKMAMDDLIKNPERFGIGAFEAKAIAKTQGEFVKWIGDKSPAYNLARKEHQRLSEIVNRVQVRDTLDKILTGPKGEERTGQFLNAVREIPKTFKKATDSTRYEKIEDVLPADEATIVRKLTQELERDAMVSKMTSEVNIPGATSPVTGKMAQLPSPLYRPTMIANWILKRGGEEGNKSVNRKAAEILANPSKAAEVLGKMPSKLREDVSSALRDFERYSKDPANVAAIGIANE